LTDTGQLPRRALDLWSALSMGVRIGLDEIDADEFFAMQGVEQERDAYDRERIRNRQSQGAAGQLLKAPTLREVDGLFFAHRIYAPSGLCWFTFRRYVGICIPRFSCGTIPSHARSIGSFFSSSTSRSI